MPMGPRGTIKQGDDKPSQEALTAFWAFLVESADTLSLEQMRRRLQSMSLDENKEGAVGEGPDSIDWKSFAIALGAAPFEKW